MTKIPETGLCLVTPKIAKEWLEANYSKQRRLNRAEVLRYARDIRLGMWVGDNGQTITFSSDGYLCDGQHRLHAIIEAGQAVEAFVIRSSRTAEEIMRTIDQGSKRFASQFYDGPHEKAITTLARFDACVARGRLLIESCHAGKIEYKRGSAVPITTSEILEYIEDNETDLQLDFHTANRFYRACSGAVRLSTIGALLFLSRFCGRDEYINEFVDQFCDDSASNLTIRYLYRYLVASKSKVGRRLSWSEELDVLLCAYEAFCAGRTASQFKPTYRKWIKRWDEFVEDARAGL